MDTLQKKKSGTAILVAIVFFGICLHWVAFCVFAIIMTFIVFLEFDEQFDERHDNKSALPYLMTAALFTLTLISSTHQSWFVTVIIFTVMVTDVVANIVGKLWKRVCPQTAQFSPIISPNKTWAGAIGALVSGAIGFPLILRLLQFWQQPELTSANVFLTPALTNHFAYGLGLTIGWLGQMGDLLFSRKKREWGVKDFYFTNCHKHKIFFFGAHGGVCDRLDSWTLVAILFGILLFGDFLISGFSNEVIKILPLLVLIHADTYRMDQVREERWKEIENEQ